MCRHWRLFAVFGDEHQPSATVHMSLIQGKLDICPRQRVVVCNIGTLGFNSRLCNIHTLYGSLYPELQHRKSCMRNQKLYNSVPHSNLTMKDLGPQKAKVCLKVAIAHVSTQWSRVPEFSAAPQAAYQCFSFGPFQCIRWIPVLLWQSLLWCYEKNDLLQPPLEHQAVTPTTLP